MAGSITLVLTDRGVLPYLSALMMVTDDPRPTLDAIGSDLAEEVRLGFTDSKDPYGRPWAPLKFRAGQPLLDTGTHLRASITHVVGRDYIEVGTTFKYAHVHQFGATIVPKRAKRLVFTPPGFFHPIFAKKVVIPARPFLPGHGMPPAWAKIIEKRVREALANEAD